MDIPQQAASEPIPLGLAAARRSRQGRVVWGDNVVTVGGNAISLLGDSEASGTTGGTATPTAPATW